MRARWTPLLPLLLLLGCQDKKPELAAPGVNTSPTGSPAPQVDHSTYGPVAGAIKGKPFRPDNVTLEGKSLSFRMGKDFFADMEIKFDVPMTRGESLEGKEFKFVGDKFDKPLVNVAIMGKNHILDSETVWPWDYTMTLQITKQTAKEVKGWIDLTVSNPASTNLAGTFTAEIKKTVDDPLDAEDAPYVQGRIVLVGDWKEEKLAAGFFGKGADGKQLSNMAGTTVKPGIGGSTTSLSFKPQITSFINAEKTGPGYRHSKMAPGAYWIYASRGNVVAAWKLVTVKAGDQQTVDLTIDLAKTGELVVTLPDEEANDKSAWGLHVVPVEMAGADLGWHYAFNAGEMKAGQKTMTVAGVPSGRYKLTRGESEGEVEIVAGKSTAVTLVRKKPKTK
jgi:hypothetical protein